MLRVMVWIRRTSRGTFRFLDVEGEGEGEEGRLHSKQGGEDELNRELVYVVELRVWK